MLMDAELLFSDEQAVTTTAASTNIVDLLAANRDIGKGEDLELIVSVDEAVTASGAATVVFALQTDDNSGFSSATDLFATAAIGKATLVAGYVAVKIKLPRGIERFLRVNYTVATGPLTAGKFTAAIVRNVDDQQIYPRAGYSVA